MTSYNVCTSVADCAALFPKTTDEVKQLQDAAKAKATAALERIIATDPASLSYQHVVRAVDLAQTDFSVAQSIANVVKETAVEASLRDVAMEAVIDLEAFGIDKFSSNKALYAVLKKYNDEKRASETLTPQQSYCLDETLAELRRKGLELDAEKFEESVRLQKRIAELGTQFDKNIADDKSQVLASAEELKGVPEGVVGGLSKDEASGKYILKMDYPTFFGVMQNCEVAETRRAMAAAFDTRAHPANLDVLHEVISLRNELAQVLGFESFSHLDLSNKMAKHPKAVDEFITSLVPRLQKKWALERQRLVEVGLPESVKLDENGDFYSYDVAFVMNQYKKKFLNVDEVAISEYFPLESTIDALFNIYERFFDISFERSTENLFWHESLTTLTVRSKKDNALLGHIVLDLFPREGKFTHACCAGIVPPVKRDDGTFAPALAVVLANFPKATADKPALFKHSDVETFFHEFGHAIHYLSGRSEVASYAGYAVKMDLVELPSQMLEEWLWERPILRLVTRHYKTGEPLPDTLIDAKLASKTAFSGRDMLRQLQFATLSLEIFGAQFAAQKPLDSTRLMLEVQERIMNGIRYNPDSRFQCSFGHLIGYSASYYGYAWSDVYSADVFTYILERDGLLSAELGRRYTECIIGVGGARDPNDMLRDFLGREPTSDAFLKRLGI